MVSDRVQVALTLVQVIALTVPFIAIIYQSMISFHKDTEYDDKKTDVAFVNWMIRWHYGIMSSVIILFFTVLVALMLFVAWEVSGNSIIMPSAIALAIGFGILGFVIFGFSLEFDFHRRD